MPLESYNAKNLEDLPADLVRFVEIARVLFIAQTIVIVLCLFADPYTIEWGFVSLIASQLGSVLFFGGRVTGCVRFYLEKWGIADGTTSLLKPFAKVLGVALLIQAAIGLAYIGSASQTDLGIFLTLNGLQIASEITILALIAKKDKLFGGNTVGGSTGRSRLLDEADKAAAQGNTVGGGGSGKSRLLDGA